MIDIALYVLLGIFIAVVAQSWMGFCKERRERNERRMASTMNNVFYRELGNIRPYQLQGLEERIEAIIDSKLAEKEGEHDG